MMGERGHVEHRAAARHCLQHGSDVQMQPRSTGRRQLVVQGFADERVRELIRAALNHLRSITEAASASSNAAGCIPSSDTSVEQRREQDAAKKRRPITAAYAEHTGALQRRQEPVQPRADDLAGAPAGRPFGV